MYLCYLDESGVPEIPGNSTHFVLAGIAIPIERWREADAAVSEIMGRYGLAGAELHTAWLLRKYLEQSKIVGFDQLDWEERRRQVARLRVAEVHRVRKLGIAKRNAQLKKVFRHTDPYIHLTWFERNRLAREIAEAVASWDWAVLFGACIDKAHFLTAEPDGEINTSAFSMVLVPFARHLERIDQYRFWQGGGSGSDAPVREFGLVIHDNNPTIALKHKRQLQNMREHQRRAGFDLFDRIIETPLFVDSGLTRMIQIADLWGYSLRRHVENGEDHLVSILHNRSWIELGESRFPVPRICTRHLTDAGCSCWVCITKAYPPGVLFEGL
jgi:hypothetical protein